MISISPSGHVIQHTKRKARDLNPHLHGGRTALAERPGQPYPATFQISVDRPGIEPGSPACRAGVVPLDHQPVFVQWTGWESNPPHRPCKGQSPPRNMPARTFKRSVPELNRGFLLTTEVCCQNTYRPFCVSDPDQRNPQAGTPSVPGIEPALSWLSPTRLGHWTTGSCSCQ